MSKAVGDSVAVRCGSKLKCDAAQIIKDCEMCFTQLLALIL